MTVTYNINAPIGQLNSGEKQKIQNINTHIAGVVQQGDPKVAEALQKVSEAALADPKLVEKGRNEVLDSLEDLAEASKAKPDERKSSRMQGAIGVIKAAASAASTLGQAWQQWGPVITNYLGLLPLP